jgi:exonuclease III
MNEIKVASFNVENFIKIDNYNDEFYEKFKKIDIILIQEYTTNGGTIFLEKLNNPSDKFALGYHENSPRMAVLYSKHLFSEVSKNSIELEHIPIHIIEKLYTDGIHKNLWIKLQIKGSHIQLLIINVHLSALIADKRKSHIRQINNLITSSIDQSSNDNETDLQLIIGGDTNYRTGTIDTHLFETLIHENIRTKYHLHDVCDENTCGTYTHSFDYIHDTQNPFKMFIKYIPKLFSLKNDRIDFIATNLDSKNTEIYHAHDYSDHSAVITTMTMNDNKGKITKRKSLKKKEKNNQNENNKKSIKRKYKKQIQL